MESAATSQGAHSSKTDIIGNAQVNNQMVSGTLMNLADNPNR